MILTTELKSEAKQRNSLLGCEASFRQGVVMAFRAAELTPVNEHAQKSH
jgi:hypothetical protein